MLLFSYYVDNKVDKAWFDSSNVLYAECDESDTALKTVRVVFKNGSMYQYDNVNVNDWVLFKNAESQGKKLNELFKKAGYPYKRLDDANVDELMEEYAFRSGNGLTISVNNGMLTLLDNKNAEKYSTEVPVTVDGLKGILESLGYKVNIMEVEEEQ